MQNGLKNFLKKKHLCLKCQKVFYDKSTLNRHNKSHNILRNKHKLTEDFSQNTLQEIKFDKNNIRKEQKEKKKKNIKKKVMWQTNLVHEKIIPVSKVSTKKYDLFSDIIELHAHVDNILLHFKNRCQSLELSQLKSFVESKSKKHFDEIIFRAMLSLVDDGLSFYLQNAKVMIEMVSNEKRITPTLLEKRAQLLKDNIAIICTNKDMYIELTDIPNPTKVVKKSAKEFLEEVIVKFDDDEKVMEEELSKKYKLNLECIAKKIQKKKEIKDKRVENMKTYENDSQPKRLCIIARKINSVYIIERKNALPINFIVNKLVSIKDEEKVMDDIKKLVLITKGWLKFYKTYLLKDKMNDINQICELIQL